MRDLHLPLAGDRCIVEAVSLKKFDVEMIAHEIDLDYETSESVLSTSMIYDFVVVFLFLHFLFHLFQIFFFFKFFFFSL